MAVERFEVGKTYRLTRDGRDVEREVTPTLVATPMGEDQHVEWMERGRLTDGRLILAAWSEVPTYPERWCNVYARGISGGWPSRHEADKASAAVAARIGVLHLHPDGTTTMEAP